MLAALLLDLAGVEHDAIVADYALTADRIEAVFGRLSGAEWFARLAEEVPAFVFGRPGRRRWRSSSPRSPSGGATRPATCSSPGSPADTVDVARGLLR